MGALVYDALLLLAVLLGAGGLFVGIAHWLTGLDAAIRVGNPLLMPFRLYLLGVVYLYFAGFWVRVGHTPGMLTWKLELVRADGGAPTWRDAAVRLLSTLASLAACGAGWLWILFDRDRLAWHDRLSGTRIIRRQTDA